jgi:Rad3-related DNA helicase
LDDPRPEQSQAISFAIDAFVAKKKRFVILEMGVGCGKSATGIAIAEYMNANVAPGSFKKNGEQVPVHAGAYFLTTQKILQEQYINDFGEPRGQMASIKSASNYACTYAAGQSCGESRRVLSALGKRIDGTDFAKHCRSQCAYKEAKADFVASRLSVTNFSYFLAETMYAGALEPRHVLVVDEAHNTEAELGKFIEVTFSEKFARDALELKVPALKDEAAVVKWIKTKYRPALSKKKSELEKALDSVYASNTTLCTEYAKQYEVIDKHMCKVNRFLATYNVDNWVMNAVRPDDRTKNRRRWEFKPVDVAPFSEESLFRFGTHVLLMSATIVDRDVFCRNLGIELGDAAFISIPSPFKKENRPVHYMGVGKMSANDIDKTLPLLVSVLRDLLLLHKDEKGIFHCTNKKVVSYIRDNIADDRLLIQEDGNREEILRFHVETKKPTVLVSPSMMEGVDLKDDLSRWQVFCKLPFPYMGDEVVKRRIKRDATWYPFSTAKSIVQAAGRSIRNENDWATTYILDSCMEQFYRQNKKMFPREFQDALSGL